MNLSTQHKGQIAHIKVELRAAEKSFIVSKPTIDARYDLIVDDGDTLHRVQIKYANHHDKRISGAVYVDLRTWPGNKKEGRKPYSADEIDAVLVYISLLDKICWIPPSLFNNKTTIVLRYEKPKNGCKSGFNLIEDYIW